MTQENPLAVEVPQQKPQGALERLEAIEAILAQAQSKIGGLAQVNGHLLHEVDSLKSSITGIAKTLAALVSELTDAGHISNDSVLDRIRKIDDKNEESRIARLVRTKIIVTAGSAQADSLVVISRSLLKTDGAVKVLSGYQIIEMPNQDPNGQTFKELLGKKPGDKFQIAAPSEDGSEVMVFVEVLQVWGLAATGQSGETPAPTVAPASAAQEVTDVKTQE